MLYEESSSCTFCRATHSNRTRRIKFLFKGKKASLLQFSINYGQELYELLTLFRISPRTNFKEEITFSNPIILTSSVKDDRILNAKIELLLRLHLLPLLFTFILIKFWQNTDDPLKNFL